MKLIKTGLCLALVGSIGVAASGCGVGPVGDLINAGLKIANNQMSSLTANEIKALSEAAVAIINGQTGGTTEPMTDAQAAALANFLQVNNINSPTDVEQIIQQAQEDPSSVQGLDELAAAFNFDENAPDAEAMRGAFESLYGGTSNTAG